MSSDFNWIVEYETLPPGDSPLPEPPAPPPRRRPRWFDPAAGLAAVCLGALLLYLWLLGGKADPLPSPDPPIARLEAAVLMEINALRNGDDELFGQVQDRSPSRRSNYQPPPEAWFAGAAGAVELIDLQLIDEDSARVDVRLTWAGSLYDLTWFYRQEEGRWLHTDWRPLDQGEPEQLASAHVQITYYAEHEHEAAVMLGQVEGFITRCCELLPCSRREPVSVTLEIDRFPDYAIREISPFHYRIPSPLQLRWPAGGNPEPLVLASLGRQVAYDLWVRPRTGELSSESLAALTLAASWLAHRLLGVDPPPATAWLEEAAVRDGMPAAITLLNALSDGVPYRSALELAFRPETVAAITALPDYFAWVLLVSAPHRILNPPRANGLRGDYSRHQFILQALNLDADPWAGDGRYYAGALPELSEVRYLAGWAIGIVRPDSEWPRTYYFRPDDELVWVPATTVGSALPGEQRTARSGLFTVTYREWDEPYVGEILRELTGAYQTVSANFGLHVTTSYSVSISTLQSPGLVFGVRADFDISSPAANALTGGSASPEGALAHEAEAAWGVAAGLLSDEFGLRGPPTDTNLMLFGMLNWQMDQLGHGPVIPLTELGADAWQPPAGASSGGWTRLADLWLISDGDVPVAEWLVYPMLITEYLVEQYGVQVVPEMLDALMTAGSMDEWVAAVTGRPLDEFEADWREWVIASRKDGQTEPQWHSRLRTPK